MVVESSRRKAIIHIFALSYLAFVLLVLFDLIYSFPNYQERFNLSLSTIIGNILVNTSIILVLLALPLAALCAGVAALVRRICNLLFFGREIPDCQILIPLLLYGFIGVVYFRYWLQSLAETVIGTTPPRAVTVLAALIALGFAGVAEWRSGRFRYLLRRHSRSFQVVAGIILVSTLSIFSMVAALSWWQSGETLAHHIGKEKRKSIILITVDGMRSANMSLYGYERETTPFLAKWGENCTVYEKAIAPSIKTEISIPSLLYGRYVGAYRRKDELEKWVSLPEILQQDGYYTVALTETWHASPLVQGTTRDFNEIVVGENSFGRGKAKPFFLKHGMSWPARTVRSLGYQYGGIFPNGAWEWAFTILSQRMLGQVIVGPSSLRRWADSVLLGVEEAPFTDEGLLRRLRVISEELVGRRPFFLYVHALLPHFGSGIREENRPFSSGSPDGFTRDVYDDLIFNADLVCEQMMKIFAESGLLEDVIVVITSDHGQLLHRGAEAVLVDSLGYRTFDKMAHVPLLIYDSDRPRGGRVSTPVSTAGLAGTLLRECKIEVPNEMEGGDLLRGREGGAAYCIYYSNRAEGEATQWNESVAVYEGSWRFHALEVNGVLEGYLASGDSGITDEAVLGISPDAVEMERGWAGYKYVPTGAVDIGSVRVPDKDVFERMMRRSADALARVRRSLGAEEIH